jgi:hypothetical protein
MNNFANAELDLAFGSTILLNAELDAMNAFTASGSSPVQRSNVERIVNLLNCHREMSSNDSTKEYQYIRTLL